MFSSVAAVFGPLLGAVLVFVVLHCSLASAVVPCSEYPRSTCPAAECCVVDAVFYYGPTKILADLDDPPKRIECVHRCELSQWQQSCSVHYGCERYGDVCRTRCSFFGRSSCSSNSHCRWSNESQLCITDCGQLVASSDSCLERLQCAIVAQHNATTAVGSSTNDGLLVSARCVNRGISCYQFVDRECPGTIRNSGGEYVCSRNTDGRCVGTQCEMLPGTFDAGIIDLGSEDGSTNISTAVDVTNCDMDVHRHSWWPECLGPLWTANATCAKSKGCQTSPFGCFRNCTAWSYEDCPISSSPFMCYANDTSHTCHVIGQPDLMCIAQGPASCESAAEGDCLLGELDGHPTCVWRCDDRYCSNLDNKYPLCPPYGNWCRVACTFYNETGCNGPQMHYCKWSSMLGQCVTNCSVGTSEAECIMHWNCMWTDDAICDNIELHDVGTSAPVILPSVSSSRPLPTESLAAPPDTTKTALRATVACLCFVVATLISIAVWRYRCRALPLDVAPESDEALATAYMAGHRT